MFVRSLALVCVTLGLTGCGPVPGGRLDGTPTAAPPDWSQVIDGERTLCEIEARPDDPHSIQLDCFLHEGGLYVQSHRWVFASWWPTTSWAAIWIDQPSVNVRMGSSLYDAIAVHVTEKTERTAILEARGYDPVPDGIAVFRFDPR
jgi:hypothetical protein